jgi:hypothetical protein
MSVDHGDARQEVETIQRRLKALETGTPQRHSDDASHLGAGTFSIALGDAAQSPGTRGIAIGQSAYADDGGGGYSVAVGASSYATADAVAIGDSPTANGTQSVAIGRSAQSEGVRSVAIGASAYAPNDDDFMLGVAGHNVQIPGSLTVTGTFSNPSARRLKRNIVPAPDAPAIFPELVEYEYIEGNGQRRLGYIADDLIGTDAERFVVLDGDGRPAAIDYLGLLVAQVAKLNARIDALETEAGNG